MERPAFQVKIGSLLGLVACIALNLWLFRLGPFLGIVGLNVTKHVLIAFLCEGLGVDRRHRRGPSSSSSARPATTPMPIP
jgi:hypothetical protein